MGLFDIFRKKDNQQKQDIAGSENILEQSLRKAAAEPVYRAEFYRNLLAEKLIVLTDRTQAPEGVRTLQKDTTVNIVTFSDI